MTKAGIEKLKALKGVKVTLASDFQPSQQLGHSRMADGIVAPSAAAGCENEEDDTEALIEYVTSTS
jgi:hypothetical protein